MGKIMFAACKGLGMFIAFYFLGELILGTINYLQGHYLQYYEDRRSFQAVMFAITMVILSFLWSAKKRRAFVAKEESSDL